jgi:hypothetical protein
VSTFWGPFGSAQMPQNNLKNYFLVCFDGGWSAEGEALFVRNSLTLTFHWSLKIDLIGEKVFYSSTNTEKNVRKLIN